MWRRWLKTIVLGAGLMFSAPTASAQDVPALHGPVTALYITGDRLLIGQGPILIDARITADNVQVTQTVDLKRHDIRAIAVSQGITFALSEDGLTTLDSQNKPLDFARGGGQHLAVRAGRVYVAALNAGLYSFNVDGAGKLTRLGRIETPAIDVATEGDTRLWIAAGEAGVWLYDVSNAVSPRALIQLNTQTAASVVRSNGLRLFIGHGNRLTILDTISILSPRLASTTVLDIPQVGDVLAKGSRVFVSGTGGPHVIALDITNVKHVVKAASFGSEGAGEQLALYNDQLFTGSIQHGLRRVQFSADKALLIAAWEPTTTAKPCPIGPPVVPQPPNLSSIPNGPVTLTWKAACNPVAYELRIDSTPIAILNTAIYTFQPRHGVTTWQVTAIDAAGKRADGSVWSFETAVDGWLATPPALDQLPQVYTPPPIQIDPHAPGTVLTLTGISCVTGLLVVISIAWYLGARAARRREETLR
ncbi:MAG: hypothetical protein IT324_29090 [Anaerolineae bacterium]|nr:hypothetical protein [Anaerolineae bacterium]